VATTNSSDTNASRTARQAQAISFLHIGGINNWREPSAHRQEIALLKPRHKELWLDELIEMKTAESTSAYEAFDSA
jgi:hypothetical protein